MHNKSIILKKLLFCLSALFLTLTLDGTNAYAQQQSISPILEYVQDNGDGTYTAHWGYLNRNEIDAEDSINEFKYKGQVFKSMETGGIITGPRIKTFEPGRHADVFTTVFDGSNLVWVLKGPDGSTRTATASSSGARQPVMNPDTSITLKTDKTKVLPGSTLTYMITIKNMDRELEGVRILLQVPRHVLPMAGANGGWTYVSGDDPQGEAYALDLDTVDAGTPENPTVLDMEFTVKVSNQLPMTTTNLDADVMLMIEGQEIPGLSASVETGVISTSSDLPNTGGLVETEILFMILASLLFLTGLIIKLGIKNRKQS